MAIEKIMVTQDETDALLGPAFEGKTISMAFSPSGVWVKKTGTHPDVWEALSQARQGSLP